MIYFIIIICFRLFSYLYYIYYVFCMFFIFLFIIFILYDKMEIKGRNVREAFLFVLFHLISEKFQKHMMSS